MNVMDKIRSMDRKTRSTAIVVGILVCAFVAFSAVSCTSRMAAQQAEEQAQAEAGAAAEQSMLQADSDDARRAKAYTSTERQLFDDLAGSLWATRDGSSVWSFSVQRDAISLVEDGTTVTMPFVIYGTNSHDGTITAVIKTGENFDVLAYNASTSAASGGDYVMINGISEEPHYRKSKTGEVTITDTPSWISGLGIDASALDSAIEQYVLAAHPAAAKATFTGSATVTEKATTSERSVTLEYMLDDGSSRPLIVTAYASGEAPSITG